MCASRAPTAALQATVGECLSIGELSSRTVADAPSSSVGISVLLGGGDKCGDTPRSISIDVICHEGRTRVSSVKDSRACGYSAHVFSRAGCPLECGRDSFSGAVCGGKERGRCIFADGAKAASCVCEAGFEGYSCMPVSFQQPTPVSAISTESLYNQHGSLFWVQLFGSILALHC